MARRKTTERWPVDFWTYFGCADEIYPAIVAKRDLYKPTTTAGIMTGDEPGLTFADLMPGFVKAARQWATEHGAPWPPYLPWAEEYSNELREREAREARANRRIQ